MGNVAYKLQLPTSSQIHPVVHVSQLKKAVTPQTLAHKSLPPSVPVLQTDHTPLAILDSKLVKHGSTAVKQVLIQWNNLPPNLATWEDWAVITRRFPAFTACGQAVSGGEEIVRDFIQGGIAATSQKRLAVHSAQNSVQGIETMRS